MENETSVGCAKTQTPMDAVTSALYRKIKIINEQSEAILDRVAGPQLEKTDQWQTHIAPGLLWSLNEMESNLERIVKKLGNILELL